jgi:hypothetical protein
MTISPPEGYRWVDAPPPLLRSKTLSFASKSPLICSPKRALTLGADGSSLNGTLALSQSDSKDARRCAVVVLVTPPSMRPPCVALLARPPPPRENILGLIFPVTFNVSASNRIPPQDSPDLRYPSCRMGWLRSGSRSGPITTQPTQREEQEIK